MWVSSHTYVAMQYVILCTIFFTFFGGHSLCIYKELSIFLVWFTIPRHVHTVSYSLFANLKCVQSFSFTNKIHCNKNLVYNHFYSIWEYKLILRSGIMVESIHACYICRYIFFSLYRFYWFKSLSQMQECVYFLAVISTVCA